MCKMFCCVCDVMCKENDCCSSCGFSLHHHTNTDHFNRNNKVVFTVFNTYRYRSIDRAPSCVCSDPPDDEAAGLLTADSEEDWSQIRLRMFGLILMMLSKGRWDTPGFVCPTCCLTLLWDQLYIIWICFIKPWSRFVLLTQSKVQSMETWRMSAQLDSWLGGLVPDTCHIKDPLIVGLGFDFCPC